MEGIIILYQNRNKADAVTFVCRIAIIMAAGLAVLCLAGCSPDPESDLTFSEITIYNIPEYIPVNDETGAKNRAFKVYVNASDTQAEYEPPAAQGFKKIVHAEMFQADTNTYTITIPLRTPIVNLKIIDKNGTPNPDYDPTLDPNDDLGPWKGKANYFSVIMSPEVVSAGVEVIWIKGGMAFNSSKAQLDWKAASLMDFRDPALAGPPFDMVVKTNSLFDELILCDPDLTE